MRYFLAIVILLVAHIADARSVNVVVGQGTVAAGSSYLVEFNSENSLANTGTVGGNWTTSGTGTKDYAYATAPAPLDGSYSAYIRQPADAGNAYYQSPSFTCTSGTCYFFVHYDQELDWNNYTTQIIALRDSANNVVMSVRATSTSWALFHGSASASNTTPTPALATEWSIWGDYAAGSGANGVAHIYVASGTDTKPSATITVSNGTSTAAADHVLLQAAYNAAGDGNAGFTIYDKFRLKDTDIGSDPQ